MPAKIAKVVVGIALSVAGVLLLRSAWDSLSWRYVLDSPIMVYAGFLLDHGYIPYRDFFDMNVPGTYFIMWFMGQVFGWGDTAFRASDLICLGIISASTFFWMRRFGLFAAIAASIAFPLWYLGYGSHFSMQREYLALVPLALLLVVATVPTGLGPVLRFILSGILTAAVVLIKPQFFLLALPVVIVLILESSTSTRRRWLRLGLAGGFILPCLATFLYLVVTGALSPFLDIVANYWPLYTGLTRYHEPIGGWDRVTYILLSTIYGLTMFYLPAAVAGLIVLFRDDEKKRDAVMITGILAAAAIYPALGGQFFGYHWIPFNYVAICATSLAARTLTGETFDVKAAVPVVLVLFMLLSLSTISYERIGVSWKGFGGEEVVSNGVPDGVNEFLSDRMQPGDLVQPLDWTSGAVHGMLMAQARPATRFIYDFHFYHHVSDPYIAALRQEFMRELSAKMPRFIIQVLDKRPWPKGEDTSRQFPGLTSFLQQNYMIAKRGRTYLIFERRDAMPGL
ncbi:MAG: hypothetical protein JSV52_09450 [Candidatus Zixiibacteriota bacterium]|nr:MAG: hypothetical protein JSV52_09450 [candidate division Zixibacteria bacterium]